VAKPTNILDASADYEQWLAGHVPVIKADIAAKHAAMAADPFSFFRATYYRWAQIWPEICPNSSKAPRILAVGDLHLENFGTWRDAEGRLVWGINDFDECGKLPYTCDLVRLATSALVAINEEHLNLIASEACASILAGYTECVKTGGQPFILEESHDWLRTAATSKLRIAANFWKKVEAWPTVTAKTPAEVVKILAEAMPDPETNVRIVHRQSGLGSLGRPRYTAMGEWKGGKVAREAKAIVPNGMNWKQGVAGTQPENIRRMLRHPFRAADPMNHVSGHWIVRRLSPHCSRVELADIPSATDEEQLLFVMGWETANIHLDSERTRKVIRADLARRPVKWLLKTSRKMSEATIADWKVWRKGRLV
jgi:uncharacterized protein DUF2252